MKATKWALDPTHSELGFKIRHLMITNVSGSFTNFQVKAETQGEDFSTAKISVTADMASISTNNAQRDGHLRNADFFEVEKYPEMQFVSTKVEAKDDNTFVIHGDLTLKGITKPAQLNVEYNGVTKDPWGNEKAGFSITGKIKRSEWGVSFNTVLETGNVALSEEVKINAEIQMVKEAVSVAA
jgi:polyisoprenoid-binding protein YceI